MRWVILSLLGASLTVSSGCATDNWSLFKSGNYADSTAGKDDPWTTQAGAEGRGGRSEKSEEPLWFRKVMMSDRAREIEANLGVTD